MNTETTLQQFNAEFIEHLNKLANIYCLIGSGIHESPMWLQYTGTDAQLLKFSSSQKGAIYFCLPIPEDTAENIIFRLRFNSIYDYFKRLKYEHLRDNYPTIFEEITGTQKDLINNFLNQ